MDQLIDLVHIRDTAEDPKSKYQQSPGMVGYVFRRKSPDPTVTQPVFLFCFLLKYLHYRCSTDLNIQFVSDCDFIETIAAQENMNDLFMNHAKLLPPDLSKKVEIRLLDRGYKDISRYC